MPRPRRHVKASTATGRGGTARIGRIACRRVEALPEGVPRSRRDEAGAARFGGSRCQGRPDLHRANPSTCGQGMGYDAGCMTYRGHIRNGVAVLDTPVALPDGTPVRCRFGRLRSQHAPSGREFKLTRGESVLYAGRESNPFIAFVWTNRLHGPIQRVCPEFGSIYERRGVELHFACNW